MDCSVILYGVCATSATICFPSDVPIGHIVGSVSASDPDIDAVLKFEWHGLKEASSDEGYVVNPETGYDFRVCVE